MPNNCPEPRHAAQREIACDVGPKISKFLRGREIFHPKSREIAPKSMLPGCTQLAYDPQRSPTTVRSIGMLCRVRLHAIPSRFRTETFDKFHLNFRGRKILHSKSREIAPNYTLCVAFWEVNNR